MSPMLKLLPLALAVAMVGCYNDHDPTLPPEEAVFGGDASQCDKACKVLKPCPEGQPTREGIPCVDFCKSKPEYLPLACVSHAASVTEIRRCGVRCQP